MRRKLRLRDSRLAAWGSGGVGGKDEDAPTAFAHQQPVALLGFHQHLWRLPPEAPAAGALEDRHDGAAGAAGERALVTLARGGGQTLELFLTPRLKHPALPARRLLLVFDGA